MEFIGNLEIMELIGSISILTALTIIIILSILDTVLKCFAFWKSARNNHLAWFICLAVFNTCGILPIIYLILYRKREAEE